jgi:hypothetical protein
MSLRHTGAVKEYLCLPLFAAAVAFLWAVNPSYIHQTVFDNSAVGAWFSLDLP